MDQIYKWILDWDEYRKEKPKGRPDFTSDAIFLLPLIIALLKSESRLKKITYVLSALMFVLIVENFFLFFKS